MLAAISDSTKAALAIAGLLALIAVWLWGSWMAVKRQFIKAQARADAYLKRLVLRWLQFTRAELHYLNRLVEDLGVDESILASTLADLERQELVTHHVEPRRGAHYTLTQRGEAWPHSASGVE
jgi:hypothetical protein